MSNVGCGPVTKLDQAPLKPHQKVELDRDYIIPLNTHTLNFSGPSKNTLQKIIKNRSCHVN